MIMICSHNELKHLIVTIAIVVCLTDACLAQKKSLDLDQVKTGQYLERAREVDLGSFVSAWLENTRPIKGDRNLNELYKDARFTYFGKQSPRSLELIKVNSEELKRIDYHSLNGDSIRAQFYEEIIPTKDKTKSERKNCTSTTIAIDYTYKFIEAENVVEIRCHYKVTCGFMIGPRLVNKNYIARYDVVNRNFVNRSDP